MRIANKLFSIVYTYFLKLFYSKLNLGNKILFLGIPIFEIYGNAIIGANSTFISNPKYNPAGLKKSCNIYVKKGALLEIGKNCGFSGTTIVCWKKIIIGNNCGFGVNVSIWDTDFHGIKFYERVLNEKVNCAEIKIGDEVWIGADSIILKGVSIGSRSVIGAGSVVTKSIPEDEVWAGNPAKFIKKIIY